MSLVNFVRADILRMHGYTPGEQPRSADVVKLNTNENPYGPSPLVFESLQSATSGDRLRKYPDPLGTEFGSVVGQLFDCDPAGVVIGNGSDDILTILTRTFVPQRGLIASFSPSYLLYRTLSELQGADYITTPFTADWDLPATWPLGKANLTYLANPNSPSGTRVSNASIERLLAQLEGPLVVDEAYADFATDNAIALAKAGRVIVTRTLSKSYSLAGIRFGFAITTPEVAREMNKVKDSYNCDVLSLVAATAALRDQEHLKTTRSKILATRQRLEKELTQRGYQVTPSQANFVWASKGQGQNQAIFEHLKSRNIFVRYMVYPGHGDGLRISVGTDEEINRLLAEL
jgi:histidinol-phosphate aminotransferase